MTIRKPFLPTPFPNNPSLIQSPVQVVIQQKPKKTPKAGKNGILINFVLDESGSMHTCMTDTLGGFNSYIDNQKTQDGVCRVTLTKFEGGNIRKLYENLDISEVPVLNNKNYKPAGSTNLLDAIGDTITSVDNFLSDLSKKYRPSVLVVIMTDGAENSSRRFTNEQIKQMVTARQEADWTFMFLGANIDAFSVGASYGLAAGSTMTYSTTNMEATMAAVSSSTTRYRAARSMGLSSEEIVSKGMFTDEERDRSI